MGYEIQRKIEWRDSGDRSNGESANNSPATGGELLPIERKVFARNSCGLFSRDNKCENSALDFDARLLKRLAGFLRQRAGKIFFS